ncbi:MAG: hypothetical protein QOG79_7237, partial [Mycobacterium sp.]|nr:hypothetical protein [Mycobacterium sp.]
VSDGAVFSSSGGHNPTLTIMATALRNARHWASVAADKRNRAQAPSRLPATGGAGPALLGAAAAAAAAARLGQSLGQQSAD